MKFLASLSSILLLVLTLDAVTAVVVDDPNSIERRQGGKSLTKRGVRFNALTVNALTRNALTRNGVRFNALTRNRLSMNALTRNGLEIQGAKFNTTTYDELIGSALYQNRDTRTVMAWAQGQVDQDLYWNTTQGLVEVGLANELDPAMIVEDTVFAMAYSALSSTTLPAEVLTILQNRTHPAFDLMDLWMQYIVDCALPLTSTVTIPSTNLTYTGGMNLAPTWRTNPIAFNTSAKRWVSACLAARHNMFGIPVSISLRGNTTLQPFLATSGNETTVYKIPEGYFWGDFFTGWTPHLNACYTRVYDHRAPVNAYANQRVCATGLPTDFGYLNCGNVRSVGECEGVCTDSQTTQFWGKKCGNYEEVITVYLEDKAKLKYIS
ncbi:hypothetical protein HK097_001082 [Rhizophlyctis rosea]|uniref:Uncharacterized protein n=1 Tax=Rhizophlyctis rosea TaxID=64517 RepID=A0AAD5S7D8_9FUNG|nr:hypothetical protein HK097_001082 [Rhizophlyctis rosea]